jgi:hypothetical protein
MQRPPLSKLSKEGRSCSEDEGHGCPTATDNQLRAIIEADAHKTTREIEEEPKFDHSAVFWVFLTFAPNWKIKTA